MQATLVVNGCTFDGNAAPRGSVLFNSGTTDIHNSTFVDNINFGDVTEGAIQIRGTLVAVHITVTNNGRTGGSGVGGLFAFNATTTLVNSIVAQNINTDCSAGGDIETIGLLSRNGTCPRQFNADPLLGTLADNGGGTPTVALGSGSPAIDVADPELCLPVDQRGMARPQTAGRGLRPRCVRSALL